MVNKGLSLIVPLTTPGMQQIRSGLLGNQLSQNSQSTQLDPHGQILVIRFSLRWWYTATCLKAQQLSLWSILSLVLASFVLMEARHRPPAQVCPLSMLLCPSSANFDQEKYCISPSLYAENCVSVCSSAATCIEQCPFKDWTFYDPLLHSKPSL